MPKQPIRVGVVGVGSIGAIHAQIYARLPQARLVAVCDTDRARARHVARQLGCRALTDPRQLVGQLEAASVAVPTSDHHAVGVPLLQAGIHVLMEKPIAATLTQADALLEAARRSGALLQVGHLERFNAAIEAARRYLTHPRFIEADRLSPYPVHARGTDVSVVLDVMIHDLDLILHLVRSRPTAIEAVGIPVLSPSEDIANARIRFASGCVATLTASRISDESLRRIRVFQEAAYLSIDFKHQTAELARTSRGAVRRQTLRVRRRAPLDDELAAFLSAVASRRPPLVSGEEARQALALALKIERIMRRTRASTPRRLVSSKL